MYLTTKRCIIRNMSLNDTAMLNAVLSDAEVMKFIEPAFDMDKTERFIVEYGLCANPLVYALELRKTKEVIGHVIFHPYDERSFEIGWVLGSAWWGRGIADEVTKALIEYAKGLAEYCIIECDEEQSASINIALQNGFELAGKDDNLNIYKLKLQK